MSFTVTSLIKFEEEIKKSCFQALVTPVESEQEVKAFLEKNADPSTTHQCWAWKIGHQIRFNDDGEPSGTAGRPILATIEGNDLTNVLVLVNRWYGGIKLGTGGLVRAYGGCAGQALVLAEKIELIEKKEAKFACNFSEWAILQYELQKKNIDYQEEYGAHGVEVQTKIQSHQINDIAQKIQDLTRGREKLHIKDEPND